ncbi:MAG: YciI family protein [Polyangiales bacterium]
MSKFMFIFRGGGIVVQPPPSPAEIGAHLAKWTAWVDGLVKAGHAESHPPPLENGGRTVRGSSKAVTDGPYAEAKDLVSGILMISATSLDAAVELARGCPIYEYDGSVEVRPFMVMPEPALAAR